MRVSFSPPPPPLASSPPLPPPPLPSFIYLLGDDLQSIARDVTDELNDHSTHVDDDDLNEQGLEERGIEPGHDDDTLARSENVLGATSDDVLHLHVPGNHDVEVGHEVIVEELHEPLLWARWDVVGCGGAVDGFGGCALFGGGQYWGCTCGWI